MNPYSPVLDGRLQWREPVIPVGPSSSVSDGQVRSISPGQNRGVTALDEHVADWWQRASALSPRRFCGIEQGLPPDG